MITLLCLLKADSKGKMCHFTLFIEPIKMQILALSFKSIWMCYRQVSLAIVSTESWYFCFHKCSNISETFTTYISCLWSKDCAWFVSHSNFGILWHFQKLPMWWRLVWEDVVTPSSTFIGNLAGCSFQQVVTLSKVTKKHTYWSLLQTARVTDRGGGSHVISQMSNGCFYLNWQVMAL